MENEGGERFECTVSTLFHQLTLYRAGSTKYGVLIRGLRIIAKQQTRRD